MGTISFIIAQSWESGDGSQIIGSQLTLAFYSGAWSHPSTT